MVNNDKTKAKFKSLSTSELKERKTQTLQSLPAMNHVIRGSLITRHIKCGKPNCHCATGTGHKSLYLSSFYRGRTFMDYVPASWEAWVRQGLENHEGIQNLLSELTELNLELLRRREKS
jgi:hypothetical protein